MCVGCGLRHRRRHRDINAVAKQSISEVEALAYQCASLCGAPAPDFTAPELGKKRGAMKACRSVPSSSRTAARRPACGGCAVRKRSSESEGESNKVPPAWTDAAAALAVSATRDPRRWSSGPSAARGAPAAPGLSPAAFESRDAVAGAVGGLLGGLGAPPPGRESSGKLGRPRGLGGPAAALYRCTGGGAAPWKPRRRRTSTSRACRPSSRRPTCGASPRPHASACWTRTSAHGRSPSTRS